MSEKYLHEHKDFPELIRILEDETSILAGLIEKDYWIMHVLYGIQKQGYLFQLKGGTSLSKGFGLIDRFSEDIDIHINPPDYLSINENPQYSNRRNIARKKAYYDQLASEIDISGIIGVQRDSAFDDPKRYNSGGIRLFYPKKTASPAGLKDGILLEAGYDTVVPNIPRTISSWAYDRAASTPQIKIPDNRAIDIPCYDPCYTFVEKLQTICTKFRQEQAQGITSLNYMRQYYDVYCLLADERVQGFIGTDEYMSHKKRRFAEADLRVPLQENEAFLLTSSSIRSSLEERYKKTKDLYYNGQIPFEQILGRIYEFIDRL